MCVCVKAIAQVLILQPYRKRKEEKIEMEMRKRSATTSVKSLWFVLGVLVLVVSTQSSFVHCRALRSTVDVAADAAAAATQGDESVGIANSFAVSFNHSSKRSSVRSLTYKLASGPSKRGPGH